MSAVHGRKTVVKVATKDISPYCKTSTLEKNPDVHDTTGYGVDDKTKSGGLRDNKFSCGGTYDNTVSTGPRDALSAIVGTTVAVIYQIEGAGTGKPQDTFNAVVGKYTQTAPVDDMVSWSCDFDISGAVTSSTQP